MPEPLKPISILPVEGLPEIAPGDIIADLVAGRAALENLDVVVVTQKVVSKAEGRLVPVDPDDPDSTYRQAVMDESARVLRRRGSLVISETRHGFICANAGVDRSNVDSGHVVLLPIDPDRSARRIRDRLQALAKVTVAVVISDTFGRTWRRGLTDIAIGCAGIRPIIDLRGTVDSHGRELAATEICIADEIAAAAELVMGKSSGTAAAIVRGVDPTFFAEGYVVQEVIRPPEEDLFR